MSPSPEKIDGQPMSARGLRLEARLTAPTWEIGLSAVVQDFTPGEVILLLDDQIAAGTRVTVQLNNSSFVGDILFCSPSGSGYEAHVSFDDVDAIGLRRTPRFPVSIPARIFCSASDAPLEGMIVDVSGEGLGIELTSPCRCKPISRCKARRIPRSAWCATAGNFRPGSFARGFSCITSSVRIRNCKRLPLNLAG